MSEALAVADRLPLPREADEDAFYRLLDIEAEHIRAQYLAELPADYVGRHSELGQPHVVATLLRCARNGLNQQRACEAAGIHHVTLQRWLKRAEDEPQSAFANFVRALKTAKAVGQSTLLQRIEKAGQKDQHWTANAWLLERTDPEQFALRKDDASVPKVVVQVGVQQGQIAVQVTAGGGESGGALVGVTGPDPAKCLPASEITESR